MLHKKCKRWTCPTLNGISFLLCILCFMWYTEVHHHMVSKYNGNWIALRTRKSDWYLEIMAALKWLLKFCFCSYYIYPRYLIQVFFRATTKFITNFFYFADKRTLKLTRMRNQPNYLVRVTKDEQLMWIHTLSLCRIASNLLSWNHHHLRA